VRAPATFALLGALLTGCSGSSCDALGPLQAEREQRRMALQELIRGGSATQDELAAADDELHAFERRVHDLEQGCERR
jgi:hypothetical protein